ncbi:BTAD domain-containing putative transcriptional regulator [Microbispora sp. H11081]|uniref:BTAD domain-containing putative transcriptional regulator n=1 Tax=Microbispora sp. H11081 TaxID=2729107 RepID=UPI0014767546|nr:BTAD domain-containing putative transcriptional regulator [Microbispora sp. H11081]
MTGNQGSRTDRWTIDVLGPLDVRSAGRAVALPPRRRSLLAVLALRAGGVVTADQLTDGLWGELPPPTAIRTLHAHIAKLNAVLADCGDERVIRRRDPGYVLNTDTVRIDRDRFEELTRNGQRLSADGRFAEAARSFESGLALWRGDALSDCRLYGWAVTEQVYLEELRIQAYEGLFAAGLAAGLTPEPERTERLIAANPLRERLWELLIVALQVSGRSGDALAAYRRARRTLVDELGMEPGEGLRQVEAGVLRGVTEPRALLGLAPSPETRTGAAGPAAPHTLPQEVSSLVGRTADIAETRAALRRARLVTLTGAGGSGKTRLAVAVARAAADDFTEAAFVDLAATHDGDGVADAIAAAMEVRPSAGSRMPDELAGRIRHDRVLVVLDNCEQVAAECAELAGRLLSRCPGLRILATSQTTLRLPGEEVRVVPALGLPDPARVHTAADLAGYDAVTLFAERAGIRRIEVLSAADARALAAICARCDGLPLAIELAAARARLLTLPEIAHRMREPYEVLVDGPRGTRPQHRALRATVEWSYGLLNEEERGALRRLSVLSGGFTLEAAAAVLPGIPVLGTMSRLVDKSLLKAVPTPSGMRYRLLETIRGHAHERLEAHPLEHTRARRDHAAYCLSRAEAAERGLQGPDLGALKAEIAEHHEDMRAATAWLTAHDPESALRLAASLWRYHYLRGRYGEGRAWLGSALAAATPAVPRRVLAKAYWAAARLAALECDYQEAAGLAESAIEAYGGERDAEGVARSEELLGSIFRELGDYGRAIELGRRSLAAAERGGDPWATGHASQLLGFASWLSGDFDSAARLSGAAIRVLTRVGDRERLAWCRLDLGAVALYTGDLGAAAHHLGQALPAFSELCFKEGIAWAENLFALVDLKLGRVDHALRRLALSLSLHHELGDRWRQASVVDALARAVALSGDGAFAAELLGAAEHIRKEIGTPVPFCERAAHEKTHALVRAMVTPSAYENARLHGTGLDVGRLRRQIARLLGRATAPGAAEPSLAVAR